MADSQPTTTNILVVEDNADDSFMLTRQLEKAQIDDHVTVIENGKDALEFLLSSSQLPLAIFLDLKLPGLSGVELLQKVKEEPRLEKVPIIIMTGSSNPNDLKECTRLGVTAFLEKPVALTTFIRTVAHLFPRAVEKLPK
jgi:CheY-like chemotaxis protein